MASASSTHLRQWLFALPVGVCNPHRNVSSVGGMPLHQRLETFGKGVKTPFRSGMVGRPQPARDPERSGRVLPHRPSCVTVRVAIGRRPTRKVFPADEKTMRRSANDSRYHVILWVLILGRGSRLQARTPARRCHLAGCDRCPLPSGADPSCLHRLSFCLFLTGVVATPQSHSPASA